MVGNMSWVQRATLGKIGEYRLGGGIAYAAAERSKTGKSNNLCSSVRIQCSDSRTQT